MRGPCWGGWEVKGWGGEGDGVVSVFRGRLCNCSAFLRPNVQFTILSKPFAKKTPEKNMFSCFHKNIKRHSKSAVSPYSEKLLGALCYTSHLIIC